MAVSPAGRGRGGCTSSFDARTGLPLAVCEAALEQARSRDLLVRDALQLRPTLQGQHFLNDLLELFLPA